VNHGIVSPFSNTSFNIQYLKREFDRVLRIRYCSLNQDENIDLDFFPSSKVQQTPSLWGISVQWLP